MLVTCLYKIDPLVSGAAAATIAITPIDVVASLPSSYTAADKQAVLSSLSAYRSQLRLEAFIERLAAAQQGRLALK